MTNHAAKLLIKDMDTNSYLVVYRSDHPIFLKSVDLPGGAVEVGETALEATLREVTEEIQVDGSAFEIQSLYDGTDYSRLDTRYSLFYTELPAKVPVTLSWEHSRYDWVNKKQLIDEARTSNDKFMHMTADQLEKMS